MPLTLYLHPLASYCHKVLIALYENRTAFEGRIVDFADEASSAELFALWPVGKIPLLSDTDRDRTVPETSIIIEYLDRHHPGPTPLIPADPEEALEARLWDRFYDLYVSTPMQKIVTEKIRPDDSRDPHGVAEARAMLEMAYGMIEQRMADRRWAAGEAFTMADCAAAPALFYLQAIQPYSDSHPNVAAYFDRLAERPSFMRTLAEAQPYFHLFPYREAIPARFLEAQ
ncbi:glutathione S-transferase family protein [Chelativorans salis]|uniref:Glutathione S-transferase family protein n=1 Tax=Chelativorans salis TaxID=2978478 RepID=A0ABT2LV55_9HYPH|nr:glutathione S-transferase family protein [Chelativorans sp. EGI FJ00035]MCT7378416.1 glutathione S-transferase family protein [Chelativorans sp. EGI FJ00035]